MELKDTREYLYDRKLIWLGHPGKMKESMWSSKCRTFNVSGDFRREWPWKTWNEVIGSDLRESEVRKDLAKNENSWKSSIWNPQTLQTWHRDIKMNIHSRFFKESPDFSGHSRNHLIFPVYKLESSSQQCSAISFL